MNVFARYAPFIQDYIYKSGWKMLRAVQNAAGVAIFGSDDNVLLAASTASGKTEAAFFPILTLLDEKPSASVGVLYIAPLKALINDQFGRLNELCEEAGIPVYRWHGDICRYFLRNIEKIYIKAACFRFGCPCKIEMNKIHYIHLFMNKRKEQKFPKPVKIAKIDAFCGQNAQKQNRIIVFFIQNGKKKKYSKNGLTNGYLCAIMATSQEQSTGMLPRGPDPVQKQKPIYGGKNNEKNPFSRPGSADDCRLPCRFRILRRQQ